MCVIWLSGCSVNVSCQVFKEKITSSFTLFQRMENREYSPNNCRDQYNLTANLIKTLQESNVRD